MKNYKKLFLFLLTIPLAAIAGYYLLTFLLVGPAEDNFFELKNHDVETHEVSVEILNSHNESILKESYKLRPDESVSRTKPFNLKNSFEQKKYICKVILDKGAAEEKTLISLHRWSTAIIDIYWDNETPITIEVVTV